MVFLKIKMGEGKSHDMDWFPANSKSVVVYHQCFVAQTLAAVVFLISTHKSKSAYA